MHYYFPRGSFYPYFYVQAVIKHCSCSYILLVLFHFQITIARRLNMLPLNIKNKGRKTFPIREKLNTPKLMDLIKPFQDITKFKFHCQVYTKSSANTWIFKYTAQGKISITLVFHSGKYQEHSYILIDEFFFTDTCRHQGIDHNLLRMLLRYIQELDFDILRFKTNLYPNKVLSQQFGFRQIGIEESVLSLKTTFIHRNAKQE